MLVIRLRPIGKKHQRTYRVVVDERRHKLQGKNVADLGWYNPHRNDFKLNAELINLWLSRGAKASDTVHNLLIRSNILKGKKRSVHAVSKKAAGDSDKGTSADSSGATMPEEEKAVNGTASNKAETPVADSGETVEAEAK